MTEVAPAAAPNGKTLLSVSGMTCNNCARHVQEALLSVPEVQGAEVRLESNSASVRWKPGRSEQPEKLLEAVNQAGYSARLQTSPLDIANNRWSPLSGWFFNVVAGACVTIPLMF
jgi:cation transport ATPase